MHWYEKSKAYIRKERLLLLVLALAFFLRVVGIGYGLPLLVVGDEPPFILAALKMLQLHTLIPALHHGDFQSILYYPPYLSYLLLIPFALIIGVTYLLFHGSAALLQAHLVSDLSPFFLAARLISVALGTLSVYLAYRVAEALFKSRIAALATAFLLATSLLHIGLSMVGRNWIFASTVFLLVLFVLTRERMSFRRRYLFSFVIAGVGMGFHSFAVFSLLMAGLYYLFFDVISSRQIVRDLPHMALCALVFAALFLVSFFIWHGGSNFVGTISLLAPKTMLGLLSSPWEALSQLLFSEPVLVALFLGGVVLMLERYRRMGAFVTVWFLLYALIFYILFRFEPRFLLPLLPVLAIAGGYCVSRLWRGHARLFILMLFVIPLFSAAWFSFLAMQGDTREEARAWVLENLDASDKVMVIASGMRITTKAVAVAELRSIDPGAVRKVDEADELLDRPDVPYVLNNITSVTNHTFLVQLGQYAKQHRYTYIIIGSSVSDEFLSDSPAVFDLIQGAEEVRRFEGTHNDFLSLGGDRIEKSSRFSNPLYVLFSSRSFGPDITIYRLRE